MALVEHPVMSLGNDRKDLLSVSVDSVTVANILSVYCAGDGT
jgi:hypothetical protein